ncbi:MAG: hypothetical protein ACJ8C4_06775 [Gemmataceae bacterium]
MRGVVLLRGHGRSELVFGQPCKESELEHEVLVTEAELLLGPLERGVRVGRAIADGLLTRGKNRFYVEVDNHTLTTKQMREKWREYGKVDGFILVICHSKARLRRLMRGASAVRDAALFALFRWLRYRNVRERWVDWTFARASV